MMKKTEMLANIVFKKQKILGRVYKAYGEVSIFDYINSWGKSEAVIDPLFLQAVEKKLHNYYSTEKRNILFQLKTDKTVSTIDHHGLLNHPFFLNSNLIFSLRKKQKYIICFPTAGISLNNSSYPCSLLFHNHNGSLEKHSLFSNKFRHRPILTLDDVKQDVIKKIKIESNTLARIFKKQFFQQKNFSQQATVFSSNFWSLLFPNAPKLVYLPLEELCMDYISKISIQNKKHPLFWLLFTNKGNSAIEKYFYGLKGAFGKNFGTYLFWGINNNIEREVLLRQGSKLLNSRNQVYSKLSPKDVINNFNSKKLYPSSLVCFLCLLSAGIRPVGGFNQINWLTKIKQKYLTILSSVGFKEQVKEIKKIQTDCFAESNLAFSFMKKNIILPTGMDLLMTKQKNLYKIYQKFSKNFKLKDSIYTLLSEIYKISMPKEEQSEKILSIQKEDIYKEINLMKKIKSLTHL